VVEDERVHRFDGGRGCRGSRALPQCLEQIVELNRDQNLAAATEPGSPGLDDDAERALEPTITSRG
jgi:hypothetical protein